VREHRCQHVPGLHIMPGRFLLLEPTGLFSKLSVWRPVQLLADLPRRAFGSDLPSLLHHVQRR
jgi:hypothetical protein